MIVHWFIVIPSICTKNKTSSALEPSQPCRRTSNNKPCKDELSSISHRGRHEDTPTPSDFDVTETSTTSSSGMVSLSCGRKKLMIITEIHYLETLMATIDLKAATSSETDHRWYIVVAGIETGVFQGWCIPGLVSTTITEY